MPALSTAGRRGGASTSSGFPGGETNQWVPYRYDGVAPVVEAIGAEVKSRFTGRIPKLTVEVK